MLGTEPIVSSTQNKHCLTKHGPRAAVSRPVCTAVEGRVHIIQTITLHQMTVKSFLCSSAVMGLHELHLSSRILLKIPQVKAGIVVCTSQSPVLGRVAAGGSKVQGHPCLRG